MKAKVEEIMKASRIRELRMELDWYWKKSRVNSFEKEVGKQELPINRAY